MCARVCVPGLDSEVDGSSECDEVDLRLIKDRHLLP